MVVRRLEVFLKTIVLACFLCLLSGCSNPILPPSHLKTGTHLTVSKQKLTALQQFTAEGRLGLKEGKRGGSIRFRWEQSPAELKILLFNGLFGTGSVEIKSNLGSHSKNIALTRSDGTTLTAETPEALVHQELGWHIPVSGLVFWLRGLPAPGIPPKRIRYDNDNQIWQLEQQGWLITYQSYQDFGDIRVPHKLILKNGTIELKFIFSEWNSPQPR